MSGNLEAMLRDMQQAQEARDLAEAEAAGVSVGQYRATQDALEEQRRREEQAQGMRDVRERRITPLLSALRPKVATAVIRDEVDETRAVAVTRRWLRNEGAPPVLVLSGETGTGKTVAAAVALAHMAGEYVLAGELAARAEPYSGDLARGVEPLNVPRPRLLVLDDLGTERTNKGGEPDGRFAPAVYKIFNQRQGTVRVGTSRVIQRTLITTNLDEDAFLSRYATEKRVKSRLSDIAYFCPCGDDDMRRKA